MTSQAEIESRPRWKHRLEYGLLQLILWIVRGMPFSLAMWCARRLGDVTFDLLRLRRRVTLVNLAAAFGHQSDPAARRRLARRTYRNFGMSFVEFALFASQRIEQLAARVHVRGARHMRAAAARGRGVIYLTAHAGSWEMLGACLGFHDRPLSIVVGDQHNPLVDRFAKAMRMRQGMIVIATGSALRQCIRTLRRGGRLGIVGDQDGGPGSLFLDFFGRAAATPSGPARFAYRTGAAVVLAFDRYVGAGEHEIQLYPPMLPDPHRSEEAEILRVMQHYNRELEAFVRRYPDAWFWMHRRWKTRPRAPGHEGAAEPRSGDRQGEV